AAVSGVAAERTEAIDPAEQDLGPRATEGLDPAEALLAYIEALYGDRLDEEDLSVVLGGIEGSLESASAFRKVGLENGDEPAYGFSAYRSDET
ncbi:MAG: hypothetical protein M8354_07585, partial [Halalkalicoccus sp.]|nr:hypothetical protein [Halalkalicoccus sp.]